MRPRPLATVARCLGDLSEVSSRALVRGASIDSRTLVGGDLFFAISGEREGLDFAPLALAAGAVAAVVPRGSSARVPGVAIEVDDPRAALGRLAEWVRREEHEDLPAVAITGSLGKTTTCGYVATLISSLGTVHRPQSSFNNDLGVPLTILNAPEDTRALVLEIGTNSPGEVRALAALTYARVGLVTSIAPAHLAGLTDLAGVEREKLSVFRALPADSVGWVPTEFESADSVAADRTCGRTIQTFGTGGNSTVTETPGDSESVRWRFRTIDSTFDATFAVRPMARYQRSLLAAALAVGTSLGVDADEMLARVGELTDPPLRGEVRRSGEVDLIYDCYNASPVAVDAAVERLEELPSEGRRLCVLGTMEELGPAEARLHHELGRRVGEGSIDLVFLVGHGAPWILEGLRDAGGDGVVVDPGDAGARVVAAALAPGDRILFKASRRAALEDFAERVAAYLNEKEPV